MQVLNLSPDFKPLKGLEFKEIKYEAFTFNGGEEHIKLAIDPEVGQTIDEYVVITCSYTKSADFINIALAVDSLKRANHRVKLDLILPYVPFARQDRLMVTGESLSIKVFTELLNSLEFNQIYILDPHSDVTPALLNNVQALDNKLLFTVAITDIRNISKNYNADKHEFNPPFVLISPDAGANKKVLKLAKEVNHDVVFCDKVRDAATGQILDFKVNSDESKLNGVTAIIVDDICDGGGTFIGIAQKLKELGAREVHLVVTHGIFSKGFETLLEHIDSIHYSDSFCKQTGTVANKVFRYKLQFNNSNLGEYRFAKTSYIS